MKKRFTPLLVLLAFATTTIGQNLITNPSAELDPTTNGWTQVSGDWISLVSANAKEGTHIFFAGEVSGTVELYQDIDVSAFAATIDAGTQDFYFQGYVRDWNGHDESQMIVEYRNASSTVLSTYSTGFQKPISWTLYSDTRKAPVNTRTIRVRLLSNRNEGVDNDGYFDDLMLNVGTEPLPIELIDFKAILTKVGTVDLSWQTATETNNSHFSIERSADANNWNNIEIIKGAGNSSTINSYRTTDEKPLAGISYYRLKQTDLDGEYSYSGIITLNNSSSEQLSLEVYPNPAKNKVIIKTDTELGDELRLFNLLGKDVSSQTKIMARSKAEITLDISSLPNGTYYIKAGTATTKLIKK